MNLSLKAKLTTAFLGLGLLPAVAFTIVNLNSTATIAHDMGSEYQAHAGNIADVIDRNLFERYGDVQAFGTNRVVSDVKTWYAPSSVSNSVAAAMNRYVDLYDLYPLMVMVDLEGKVIAVNDRDKDGKAIDTKRIYAKNFQDAEWFKRAIQGDFSTNTDGTFTGTVVEELASDPDVQALTGDEGLVVGFSAPVKDEQGNTIGVWKNFATFTLVEDVLQAVYQELKHQGLSSVELSVLDAHGEVIANYDPFGTGSEIFSRAVLSGSVRNWAASGLVAAQRAVHGETGNATCVHPIKGEEQFIGFAHSKGALGFPGMGWSVLVHNPTRVALAGVTQIDRLVVMMLVATLLAVLIVSWLLTRSIVRPIDRIISTVAGGSKETKSSAEQVSSTAQTLAQTANSQAAALEETSASIHQISAMSARNSENSDHARALSIEVKNESEKGSTHMSEMQQAMSAIQKSADETEEILRTIDDIAFQTNLLALNAAVEAARAGDAGKGFAVVAEAVRSLAHRSAEAAKETGDRLKHSRALAVTGVTTAKQVAESLNDIRTKADQSASLVEEIASASKEQTRGLGQITAAVSDLDRVTQSNAAVSEEAAAAGEQLLAQSRLMGDAVIELGGLIFGEHDDSASQ